MSGLHGSSPFRGTTAASLGHEQTSIIGQLRWNTKLGLPTRRPQGVFFPAAKKSVIGNSHKPNAGAIQNQHCGCPQAPWGPNSDQYCNICNGFHYQTQIMTNDAIHSSHIVDTAELYTDIANGTLPAISFVKPSGWVDGHPASSKWDLFEGFTKKIVDEVKANPTLWESSAIFMTVDEGGGYYDSGYVQALDRHPRISRTGSAMPASRPR